VKFDSLFLIYWSHAKLNYGIFVMAVSN